MTSSAVMCVLLLRILMTRKSRDVSWPDVMFAANPVRLSFWLADEWTNYSINTQRFLRKSGPFSHPHQSVRAARNGGRDAHQFTKTTFIQKRIKSVHYPWAVILGWITWLCFSLSTFFPGLISLYFRLLFDVSSILKRPNLCLFFIEAVK